MGSIHHAPAQRKTDLSSVDVMLIWDLFSLSTYLLSTVEAHSTKRQHTLDHNNVLGYQDIGELDSDSATSALTVTIEDDNNNTLHSCLHMSNYGEP